MVDQYPLFGVFPALRLAKGPELGEWCIGTPPETATWRSERFKELALKLVESFKKSGFKESPMLWHRDRGFDRSAPEPRDLGALVLSVNFAVLDANDQVLDRDDARATKIGLGPPSDLCCEMCRRSTTRHCCRCCSR